MSGSLFDGENFFMGGNSLSKSNKVAEDLVEAADPPPLLGPLFPLLVLIFLTY